MKKICFLFLRIVIPLFIWKHRVGMTDEFLPSIPNTHKTYYVHTLLLASIFLTSGITGVYAIGSPPESTIPDNLEVIYSPDIMNNLINVINNAPASDTYQYDEDVVQVNTVVTTSGTTHSITYNVYTNNIKSDSYSFTVEELRNNLFRVYDTQVDVLVTSDPNMSADRHLAMDSSLNCVVNLTQTGHGTFHSSNCVWQSYGKLTIKPTSGKVSWSTPSVIWYWFTYYTFDEVKINPWFASSSDFWSNSPSGSLSFSGIYSSHSTYTARLIFYYQ